MRGSKEVAHRCLRECLYLIYDREEYEQLNTGEELKKKKEIELLLFTKGSDWIQSRGQESKERRDKMFVALF